MPADDPHADQPLLTAGAPPVAARLTVILVHGRGGAAADVIARSRDFRQDDVAYLAPQAAERTWYPRSFLAPMPQNEPGLGSGLGVLTRLVAGLEAEGVPARRIAFYGFSQGACLALEYAARHARRYAGVFGLSGGLIGPPDTARDYAGGFDGTPVFLGCSDVDPHIPLERVHESADVFRRMGATVDERIYPGMGHVIVEDELEAVRQVLRLGR
jgi:predicted esterase